MIAFWRFSSILCEKLALKTRFLKVARAGEQTPDFV
jgi:hypothetical protein